MPRAGRSGFSGTAPKRRSLPRNSWTAAARSPAPTVGPHGPRKYQLRAGRLPQQKVARTMLAPGADQQIHGRPESPSQSVERKLRDPAGRRQNRVARRIVHRDPQPQPRSPGSRGFGPRNRGARAAAPGGRAGQSPAPGFLSPRTAPSPSPGTAPEAASAHPPPSPAAASCPRRTRRASGSRLPRPEPLPPGKGFCDADSRECRIVIGDVLSCFFLWAAKIGRDFVTADWGSFLQSLSQTACPPERGSWRPLIRYLPPRRRQGDSVSAWLSGRRRRQPFRLVPSCSSKKGKPLDVSGWFPFRI